MSDFIFTNYIQSNQCYNLIAGANETLSIANTGMTALLPVSAAATKTLPAAQNGLRYRIINIGPAVGIITVVPTAPATITGILTNVSAAGGNPFVTVVKAAAANFTFTAASAAGDYVDLICNGVNWYVIGQSSAVGFT